MTAGAGCTVKVTQLVRIKWSARKRTLRTRCNAKPVIGQVIYEYGDTKDTDWVCAAHARGDHNRVVVADRVTFQAL